LCRRAAAAAAVALLLRSMHILYLVNANAIAQFKKLTLQFASGGTTVTVVDFALASASAETVPEILLS
jgi:hypothetical protein